MHVLHIFAFSLYILFKKDKVFIENIVKIIYNSYIYFTKLISIKYIA